MNNNSDFRRPGFGVCLLESKYPPWEGEIPGALG